MSENIGKHCSFQTCNRLDFLPIKCDHCELFYCKEHSNFMHHKCEEYKEVKRDHQVIADFGPLNKFKCSLENCLAKEMVEFRCEFCEFNFCMRHRVQIDHQCSKLVKNEIKKNVEKKNEFKFELKQNVSEKNSALAGKLLLMKMRQSAIGPPGLPEEAKFYFFVQYSKDNDAIKHIDKRAFYFSLKWPIGKCVEFLLNKYLIDLSNLGKIKLFLNDEIIDSSIDVENFVKTNSLIPGTVLQLKKSN